MTIEISLNLNNGLNIKLKKLVKIINPNSFRSFINIGTPIFKKHHHQNEFICHSNLSHI